MMYELPLQSSLHNPSGSLPRRRHVTLGICIVRYNAAGSGRGTE
jgi:hypothetical protein